LGIGNAAVADVILTSLGRIFVKNFAPGFTWETPEGGRLSSIRGQTVHMLQNIAVPTFERQPGNQSWQDMIMLRGGNARGLTIMNPSERIAQTQTLVEPQAEIQIAEAAIERQAEQTRNLIQQLIESRPIEVASVLQNQLENIEVVLEPTSTIPGDITSPVNFDGGQDSGRMFDNLFPKGVPNDGTRMFDSAIEGEVDAESEEGQDPNALPIPLSESRPVLDEAMALSQDDWDLPLIMDEVEA